MGSDYEKATITENSFCFHGTAIETSAVGYHKGTSEDEHKNLCD